jgi:DegV family protein with EDD domain
MSRIAVITDSTSNLPSDLAERHKIEIAPQILIWGEDNLLDGVDISADEFYARLQTSSILPKSSQPTVGHFMKIFEPHVNQGNSIITVVISNELSGTVQSALQAKEEFPGAKIEVIDSRSVGMALAFQALAAARAAEEGKSFEEVVDVVHRARQNSGVIFVVDTLEFLHRGGRIGGAARLLGTALSLKPLLHIDNGRIEPLERVRTKMKACQRMLDLIEERVKGKSNIRLAAMHAASPKEAEILLEEAIARCNPVETSISVLGPVLGTHAGPGTVGIAYCTEV